MPRPVELRGLAAAPGVASGHLFFVDTPPAPRSGSGDPATEAEALRQALAGAVDTIRQLAARQDGDAVAILDFQIEMLEDPALAEPALARIAGGADAATAWADAIAAQVADYRGSDSEYFRARAADIRDLGERVLRLLAGSREATVPPGSVLAGEDVTPTRFLSVDWSQGGGLILAAGSPSSHVAMLARARGVPMVVRLGAIDRIHETALVDGDSGAVVLSPGERHLSEHAGARARNVKRSGREADAARAPARTADGVPVTVMLNVSDPAELAALDPETCDGIGLVRTEFLFHRDGGMPDEETQYRAYRAMLEWARGRPVVIRTLDAGGDKPIAGLTVEGESNPFLGTRGIRLSLARPEVFRLQIHALMRAASHGELRVMLPMVTVPEEIERTAALFDMVAADLDKAKLPFRRPPLGIMVEVPAVAIEPQLFARAAFFSIGSNDLTQYVTASARDTGAVALLGDPGHPAVTSLIRRVIEAGRSMGRPVSLCGDMAGDPKHIRTLLAAGLRTFSVAPAELGRTKLAIGEARIAPV